MATQFQDGEERIRNGWVYQRREGGRWAPVRPANDAGPTLPRVIEGPPDTRAVASERRAEEDQAMERERLRLAREAAERDAAKDQRTATRESGGTVEERRAAFLSTRLASALREIEQQARANREALTPSIGTEAARAVAGDTAANYMNSPQRQAIEGAQFNAIDAALTLGTGAAYTREQIEGYRRSLFPALGDSPEAVASKRRQLEAMIAAARLNAGSAAPQIDAALAALYPPDPQSEANQPAGTVAAPRAGGPPSVEIVASDQPEYTPDNPPPGQVFLGWGESNGQRFPQFGLPSESLGRRLAIGAGDIVEGAGDILGLVSNPVNAGINAVFGTDLGTDLGQAARDMTGLPSPVTANERLASAINRGGVGGLSFAGIGRGAANVTSGVVSNALSRFGAAPLTDAAAGASGSASGEIANQMGVGPVGQTVAALAGGGVTVPVASALASRLSRTVPTQSALQRAGQAEGVTVNRVMADPELQTRVTGAQATLLGGPIINRNMARIGDEIEARVDQLGRGGTALDENVAGGTIRRNMQEAIRRTGRHARELYDAADVASEGVRVAPTTSVARLDDLLARLGETPETNSAEISFLNSLRNDLQNDLSVGALRRIRTSLRKRISNGGLVFGEDEANVLGVMDAAADDIEAGLREAGRDRAVTLFREADNNYRQRAEYIRNGIQRLIGRRQDNLSNERVFANFRAMASPRGDNQTLARVISDMEPEDQADTAATFAAALGRNGRGEFSTAELVRQARRLPQAARENIFGHRGARSLDNLIELSRAHSRVMAGLNNSRTGQAVNWNTAVTNFVLQGGAGGAAGFLAGGGPAAALGAGAVVGGKVLRDVTTARMLMSPAVQQWLRDAPTRLSSAPRHIDRLTAVAVREPALAQDIGALQQALTRALNDNTTPGVAASEPDQNRQ